MKVNIVYNDDCIKKLKSLPNESVDCVVTDFPYNVGKDYGNSSDKQNEEEYYMWIDKVCKELYRVLKMNSNFIFYIGTKRLPKKLQIVTRYFNYEWVVVQYKPTFRSFGKTGFTKSDLIVWCSKGKGKVNRKYPDVIVDKPEKMKIKHPTFKSNFVSDILIKNFTKEGDVVLDPLAGSGSFLVACKKNNRKYIGIELNKQFCDIIKGRLRKEVNE